MIVKVNISKLILTKDQMNIIIIGQHCELNYTIMKISGIFMNIFKLENKSSIVSNKDIGKPSEITIKIEKKIIFFSKLELTSILNLYSKQVAKGYWRDYALDSKIDNAIFSIYRHTHDKPMFQIIKNSQKGFRNKPSFYIKKGEEIVSKSKSLFTILSNFEKNLSIKKLMKL